MIDKRFDNSAVTSITTIIEKKKRSFEFRINISVGYFYCLHAQALSCLRETNTKRLCYFAVNKYVFQLRKKFCYPKQHDDNDAQK